MLTIPTILHLLAAHDPQGFNQLNQTLTRHLSVAGENLTLKQAMFCKDNFTKLPEFLATDEGKLAVQTFVQDWIDYATKPKA